MIDLNISPRKLYPMSGYNKNIKWMIKNSKYSQKELARLCGISETVMSRIVNQDIQEFEIVDKICGFLGVPVSRVFDRKADELSILSDQEKRMLQEFSRFSPDQQELIIAMLKGFK